MVNEFNDCPKCGQCKECRGEIWQGYVYCAWLNQDIWAGSLMCQHGLDLLDSW